MHAFVFVFGNFENEVFVFTNLKNEVFVFRNLKIEVFVFKDFENRVFIPPWYEVIKTVKIFFFLHSKSKLNDG